VVLALLGLTTPASANGRFPRAQRLIEDPTDPARLILGATYGMLVTTDRGESWRYVCEAAYGVTDLTIDARMTLTPDGTLLAGIYAGVSRAAPNPCDFQRTLGMNNREAVPDFAIAKSEPGRVLAIKVSVPKVGMPFSQLYRSDDDGATWQALGEPLPESLSIALTIDVAPSDAERVYISGLGPGNTGVLLRSDDGGVSFEAFEIPTDAAADEHPYIAAVDAEDPDRLYVRTDLWAYDPEAGVAHASDALLYSDDGGASFVELLRKGGKLFGFTFSPDGSELLVGYGDPVEAGGLRLIDEQALGMYRAPKGSSEFEQRYAGAVGCLTWTTEGIYVCTLEAHTGFSLGLIAETDFDLSGPAELEPLLRLNDVAGPIECEVCQAGDICRDYWYAACSAWGRADCTVLKSSVCSEAGAGGAPATEQPGGAGGDAPAGGASAAGQGAAADSTGGVAATDGARPRGGCACRANSKDASSSAWLVLLLLLRRATRRRWC
jgi:MYXO-CTERM domain-containing protein